MNKKEIIVYVVGGIVFIFLRILLIYIVLGLFYHPNLARALNEVYEIIFLVFISYNFFHFTPIIWVFTFLEGSTLSLFICYGYYKQQARNKERIINPISKKSLFIAVTVFVGFVLFTAMVVWLGGF